MKGNSTCKNESAVKTSDKGLTAEEIYEEGLIKMILNSYVENEGMKLYQDAIALKSDPTLQSTEDERSKFLKQVDGYLKSKEKSGRRKQYRLFARRAAVFLIVSAILFGSAMVSIEAFRIKIFNLFSGTTEEFTSYQYVQPGEYTGSVEIDYSQVTWENAYAPSYLPEGYKVSKAVDGGNYRTIKYANSSGEEIVFKQRETTANVQIDTEDIKDGNRILVNGFDASYVLKGKLSSLSWYNGSQSFSLMGPYSEKEMIKIAESVTIIK